MKLGIFSVLYNDKPLEEQGWEIFAERFNEILNTFATYGVRFAMEVHPTEIAYNIETAARAVEVLGYRKEFGFNFDPSHFVWQLICPTNTKTR